MRIRDLRAKAREDAQGNKMKIVIPVFIMLLVSYVIGLIPRFIDDETSKNIVSIITSIISVLVVIPLSYAIIIRTIKIARKEELSSFVNDVFDEGIRHGFSCAWGIFKKIWYWVVLLIVGYILNIVGAALTITTVLSTPFTVEKTSALVSPGVGLALALIGFALIIFTAIELTIAAYKYYLVQFLKHDYPEKSTSELLEKSKEMMDGNKAKAFVIPLTFIGWVLLSALCMAVVSVVFNLIWPPMVTFIGSVPTMPVWATVLMYVIVYFIFSFVLAYLQITYAEFYLERNPLEIYNEDYVKPETNAKKYMKIIGWVYGTIILLYVAIVGLGATLYNRAGNMVSDYSNILEQMQQKF